jgi:OOP family OmpA-OmpF porin
LRLYPALLATAAALALAAPARAADDPLARGIDPIGAKPAVGHDALFTTEGARFAPARSYHLDLTLDFASGLMAFQLGDEKVGDLIRSRLDLHLVGSYALTDWAEVGLDVPFTAWQADGFEDLERATGFAPARPAAYGLGDMRALGKVRLLSQASAPLALALIAELRLPTGADQDFLGERGLVLAPRAVVERTFFDKLRLGLEAGYRYRQKPGRYVNLYVGDELTVALAGSYELPRLLFERWFAFGELLAATPARAPFNGPDADALKTPLGLLLGLRAQVHGNLHALVGGGTGLAMESGFGRESFRLFAALRYERIFHDRDGDGVADEDDRCPDQAEDDDGFEDSDGCPDPDNDRDGVPDEKDRCPDTAGLEKLEGCPDRDGDGTPDDKDRCVEVGGPPEYEGCPDGDGDEVPDIDDKCPTISGPASEDGCPGKPLATLDKNKLVIKGAITFDTGKATIKKESFPVLDTIAELVRAHPEIKRLLIEGHTDDVGSAAFNLDLSRRRAQSVVKYLVDKAIEPRRLQAEGFGEERPIAPNTTPLGRARNRRVEFTVVE